MATINHQQKITPCLWFDKNAEEAVNFYATVFGNASIESTSRYGDGAPLPKGTALVIQFSIEGQQFLALNGGPHFKLNEAVSFVVNCEAQSEIDYFWEKLSAGGEIQECGWLKDKFGLSWQVVPTIVNKMMTDDDEEKSGRVMAAILKMKKIEIQKLEQAYNALAMA